MERIDSFEGKLFYKIYMLCQKNQINEEQKGKLKDLVILRDERIEIAMNQYLEDRDEFRLLENFHNYSGEEYSPKSYNNFSDDKSNGSHSKFKGKRPAKMQLPKKTFMINLRKQDVKKLQQRDTDVTTCSKGFLLSTARSSDNRKALAFNERYTQQNWSECE
ncbi:unnamed protein product (macronuclear) [Paramecium tetraurelia]|uniref:Uncharacterized protein n=1 Tax=Paramecium tetraurelia TaxID=5888 RepID=A0D5D4_PARTE|nr:uncharacterized protein GSPATT00013700001 [Paramecium tetraurelia]CAK78251.1 unnamed protein product [Paramecium tetraurelia]|eukprot:XP_001445648.1 hypothetical protein (macronuclear) [Paramecium tetraurelia strain d4-2]